MGHRYDGMGALQAIAKREGKETAEIPREIEKAIRSAMQNNDPEIRALWRVIAPDGKPPSAEELIERIAAQADGMQ